MSCPTSSCRPDCLASSKITFTVRRERLGCEDFAHAREVAPNGLMFVKPEVRSGVLGRMLRELLDTRIMVKQAMKSAKGDKAGCFV